MTTRTVKLVREPVAGRAVAEQKSRRSIAFLDDETLASPLPPTNWLCAGLGLAPGAPVCIAGYGYSGKTLAMQSFALSVASGRPAWDVFTTKRGRVVHIDFEQGKRQTIERYQRLALGGAVDIGELVRSKMLAVSVLPPCYLNDGDAEEVFTRAAEGASFVLIDSLRAAIPGADENDSGVRRHLDVLCRISERTGATIASILHTKKPQGDGGGEIKHSIRGSSALYDACASVFVFDARKGAATIVHHEKDRARGKCEESFALKIEDVDVGEERNAGLRVRHNDLAQVDGQGSSAKKLEDMKSRICALLRSQAGGVFLGDRGALRQLLQANQNLVSAALSMLVGANEVVFEKNPTRIRIVGAK